MESVPTAPTSPGTTDRATSVVTTTPIWLLCLAGTLLFALMDLRLEPDRLWTSLGDADDAMRLVAVRDLLAGTSWWDLVYTRIGLPDVHVVSHWSRLIDAPIAALITLFALIVPAPTAELAARTAWPLMLLFSLMWVCARFAEKRSGRIAAFVAIALVVYASAATVQFRIGRVDHHNAMILCAVGGSMFLALAFTDRRSGHAAGVLLGLGTAVGFEALPLTVGALCIASIMATITKRGQDGVVDCAVAFAVTTALAVIATQPPAVWLAPSCDALSVNLVVLACVGAAGLYVVKGLPPAWGMRSQLAILAAFGVAGFVLFAAVEPRCLAGPLGQVDPAIGPMWLWHVQEGNTLIEMAREQPEFAVLAVATLILGLLAMTSALRRQNDDANRFLLLLFLTAAALTAWQAKFIPYLSLLALPAMAMAIARIEATANVSALSRRLLVFLVVNQQTTLATFAGLVSLLGMFAITAPHTGSRDLTASESGPSREAPEACNRSDAIEPLRSLPPGLAYSHYDLAPHLIAHTGLDALAGPYHRLDKALLELNAIANADPPAARQRLAAIGAAYIVDCEHLRGMPGLREQGFYNRLHGGDVPDFLEPVALIGKTPLKVWRIKP